MAGKKPRAIEADSLPNAVENVAVPVRSVVDKLPERVSEARLNVRHGAAYIAALRHRFSPADLPEMIAEAYRVAFMQNDARTMLEAARLITNYVAGKPPTMDNGAGAGANALQAALSAWIENAKAQAQAMEPGDGVGQDVQGDGVGRMATGRLDVQDDDAGRRAQGETAQNDYTLCQVAYLPPLGRLG